MDTHFINEEVDDILGISSPVHNYSVPISPEEQKEALKAARNALKGRPKASEPKRIPLSQLNVKCDLAIKSLFEELSLKTGRTKRDLLREALLVLKSRYLKY